MVDAKVQSCWNRRRSLPVMRTQLALFLVFTATVFAEPVSLFNGKTLEGWEGDAKRDAERAAKKKAEAAAVTG